ncbi:MAG: hypothetical protein J6038_05450 [Bacilli bacterium]|nr:hypothetical protein [Bacilli bacterium]
MEDSVEKVGRSRVPLMVISSIFLVVCLLFTAIMWSLGIMTIIPEEGEAGEVIGAIIAIIVIAGPFILMVFAEALLNLIFAPLTFFLLRKSTIKGLSVCGMIYFILNILMLLSAVGRFLLFYFGVY